MKNLKMHTLKSSLAGMMKDPKFKDAYDKLEPQEKLIRAAIQARISRDVTQKELAQKLGTKQSAISRFESGKNKNPTLAFLYDIAGALGLEIEIKIKSSSKA